METIIIDDRCGLLDRAAVMRVKYVVGRCVLEQRTETGKKRRRNLLQLYINRKLVQQNNSLRTHASDLPRFARTIEKKVDFMTWFTHL